MVNVIGPPGFVYPDDGTPNAAAVLTTPFFQGVVLMAREFGMRPEDVLSVFGAESGVNPHATRDKDYKGLNTIGNPEGNPVLLRALSVDEWNALPNMEPHENLEISWRFYRVMLETYKLRGFANALDLYLCNASPASWSTLRYGGDVRPSTPLAGYNTRTSYAKNAGMDINKDGVITVGDLAMFLRSAHGRAQWAIDGLWQYMVENGLRAPEGPTSPYRPAGHTSSDDVYDPVPDVDEALDQIARANRDGRPMQSFERDHDAAAPSSSSWLLPALGLAGAAAWIMTRKDEP